MPQQGIRNLKSFEPRQSDEVFSTSPPPPGSSGLPFSLEVNDWELLSRRYVRGTGNVETSLVTVVDPTDRDSQPSRFIDREIEPENQRFEIGAAAMLPLGTRMNGYNTYTAYQLAKQGVFVGMTGTNQTHGYSMLHDTQASMVISQARDERRSAEGRSVTKPNTSADFGYSMSKMKNFAKLVLAEQMGWDIALSKGVEPCIAEAKDYRQMANWGTLAYLLADGAQVPINIFRDAQETGIVPTARRAWHWRQTFSLSRQHMANTRDKWETIRSGEAGTFLPAVPESMRDTVIVVHSFNQSAFNDQEIFAEQLDDFPNAQMVYENGRHLSFVSARAVGNFATDFAAALELIEAGASPQAVLSVAAQPVLAKRPPRQQVVLQLAA